MNDLNPTAAISSLKHLSSQSIVSLELEAPLETSLGQVNMIEYLDTEVQTVEVLLAEMVEIRQVLQDCLQDLFAIYD